MASLVVQTVKHPPAMQDIRVWPLGGRSLGERNGYPLQYSCLEKHMDRGAWRATVHRVAKSWMQLSTHIFIYFLHLDCLELCIQETLLCGLSYLSRGGIVLIRIICPKPESSTKCMIRKKKKKFMFIYLWNVFMTLLCTLICRGQKGKELVKTVKI